MKKNAFEVIDWRKSGFAYRSTAAVTLLAFLSGTGGCLTSGGGGRAAGTGNDDDATETVTGAITSPPSVPAPALRSSEPVGALPATTGVTDDGTFTYDIPLDTPKGRAGMEPTLALSYSSRAGDGLLGVGWSLSGGGSAITRCPRVHAAGRKTDRVTFTIADRFCLDGQNLLVTSGTYGAAGSEYRTELDIFAKIVLVSVTTPTGGIAEPAEFKVFYKNGQVGTFLRPATSLRKHTVAANGTVLSTANVTLTWPLKKRADRAGNAVLYQYEERVDNDPLLTRIDYTACDLQPCTYASSRLRRVEMVLESRTLDDVMEAYVGGARVGMSRRIKEIVVSVANASGVFEPMHRYLLRYVQGAVSGRGLLKGVKKCDESSPRVCLPETVFSWNGEAAAPFVTTPDGSGFVYNLVQLDPTNQQRQLMPENGFAVFDVNGDGNDDVVLKSWPTSTLDMTEPTLSATDLVLFGDGHSYFTSSGVAIDPDGDNVTKGTCVGSEVMDPANAQAIDLDGDGRIEWVVPLNTGCSFTDTDPGVVARYTRVQPGTSAGVTTVGVGHRVYGTMAWNKQLGRFTKVTMPPGTGTGGFDGINWSRDEVKLADMTGDGLPEYLYANLSSTSERWSVSFASKLARTPAAEPQVGYFSRFTAPMAAMPSKANGLFRPSSFQLMDEDGDGRGELLQADHRGNRRSFFYSSDTATLNYRFRQVSGTQSFAETSTPAFPTTAAPNAPAAPTWGTPEFGALCCTQGHWYPVDVNGDGLKDALYAVSGDPGATWELRTNMGNGAYTVATQPGPVLATLLTYPKDTLFNVSSGGGTFARGRDNGIRMADMNGDGREDLILLDPAVESQLPFNHGSGYHSSAARIRIAYANGSGWDAPVETEESSNQIRLYRRNEGFTTQIGDINGDGLPEIIDMVAIAGDATKRRLTVWRRPNMERGLDVIRSVADERGTAATVEYDHLSLGTAKRVGSIFAADTHVSDLAAATPVLPCAYPASCVSKGIVVRRFEDLRSARQVQNLYSYRGARFDMAGRGWLGFAATFVMDQITSFRTTRQFNLVPIQGTATGENGPGYHLYGQRDTPTFTWKEFLVSQIVAPGLSVPETPHSDFQSETFVTSGYPARHTLITKSHEVYEVAQTSANLRRSYSTSTQYDSFGNPTTVQTNTYTTNSGVTADNRTTITSVYDNTTSNWLIGLERRRTEVARTLEDSFGTGCAASPSFPCSSSTRVTSFDYFANGMLQRITREPDAAANTGLKLVTEFVRDGAGLITRKDVIPSETGAVTRSERKVFDESGVDVVEQSNARGHKSWFFYQPRTRWLYAVADQNGRADKADMLITHDTLGRVRERAQFDGALETISYGVGVQRKSIADGQSTVTFFDPRGRPIIDAWNTFAGTSAGTETFYNPLGQPSAVIFKENSQTLAAMTASESTARAHLTNGLQRRAASYDAMGRMRSSTDGVNGLSFMLFPSPLGSMTVTDPNGNVRKTFTDHNGHVRTLRQTLTGTTSRDLLTSYGYDAQGALTSVRTPDAGRDVTTHDVVGRPLERRQFLANGTSTLKWRKVYSSFDEVASQHHGGTGQGVTSVSFVRDALGRVTERKDIVASTAPEIQTFIWDPATALGQLDRSSTTGAAGAYSHQTRFTYDDQGRLSERRQVFSGATGNESLSFGYTYDGRGRLDTLRYPETSASDTFSNARTGGLTLKYVYQAGQLRAIRDNARPATDRPIWQVDAREGYGPVKTGTFDGPNLVTATWARDPNDTRVTSRSITNGGSFFMGQTYQYERNGQIKRRDLTGSGMHEIYGYDSLNRLRTYERNGRTATTQRILASFAYDDVGNITGVDTVASAGSPDWPLEDETYTASTTMPNFTASHTVGSTTTTYVPDSMGRIERAVIGSQAQRQYTYTTFDLPRTITLPVAGKTVTFAYTPEGARARKTTTGGGTTVDVAYVGDLYERRTTTNNGTITGASVFRIAGEDGILAEIVHPWSAGSLGTRVKHLIMNDQQGSPQLSIDGATVTILGFLPFGKRAGATAPATATLGYTGHIQDDDLGLIDMNSRLYDVRLRRFISRDPAADNLFHAGGLNPYGYALGDPINRVDRNGMQSEPTVTVDADRTSQPEPNIGPRDAGPGEGNVERSGEVRINGAGPSGAGALVAKISMLLLEHGLKAKGMPKPLWGNETKAAEKLGDQFGKGNDVYEVTSLWGPEVDTRALFVVAGGIIGSELFGMAGGTMGLLTAGAVTVGSGGPGVVTTGALVIGGTVAGDMMGEEYGRSAAGTVYDAGANIISAGVAVFNTTVDVVTSAPGIISNVANNISTEFRGLYTPTVSQ